MQNAVFLDDALAHFAGKTPDADAVSLIGETISYADLNALANRIAAHLAAAGVAHGDRVVLCAAKSPLVIAAMNAILRIGAVYVPIDPSAPAMRAQAQAAAVAPGFVVADAARARLFADSIDASCILDLGQIAMQDAPQAETLSVATQRSPEDAAYILMTSGTTGVPKGIVHTHKSGLTYARMAADLCHLRPSDRVSHHTPVHFDMSIFDIFSTALAGACVVIIPEMHAKLPASLSELTQQERITVWYSVPFAIIQMAERGALHNHDLSALRVVMFAGEKMPPRSLRAFAEHTPNARFLNAYGPTETNHCVTAQFTRNDLDGLSALPIGCADNGVIARVDEDPTEPGAGELLIASDQVMREYWRAPDLTQACICTLPDENGQPRRFYRTGDIVRRAADGQFLLVGRKDRQIKLRGYRIELDEIELALLISASATEAVVVVAKQQIHAFVTGRTQPDPTEIRARIAEVLPHYAVPDTVVWLDAMPRTSTGKIDRATLLERANAEHAA